MRFPTERRFGLLTLAATALAAGAGCGSSAPIPPDAAWTVNFTPGTNEGDCSLGVDFTDTFGAVGASTLSSTIAAGSTPSSENGATATVTCSVTGSSSFDVIGTASDDFKSLTVSIPSITPGATSTSPVSGTASYASAHNTASNSYGGACSFYFKDSETVTAGKIWGSFVCPSFAEEGQAGNTCALRESYFVFENCGE